MGNFRDRCKQCKRTSFKSSSQQLDILPSKRFVSQALSAKGVACEISKWSGRQNQCDSAVGTWKNVDIHACETLSAWPLRSMVWLKNGLRSNQMDFKFHKFSGDQSSCCTHMQPEHFEYDGYSAAQYSVCGIMIYLSNVWNFNFLSFMRCCPLHHFFFGNLN